MVPPHSLQELCWALGVLQLLLPYVQDQGGLRHPGQGWLPLKSPRLPTKLAEPGLD